MSRKAIWALIVVVVLPVLSYLIVKGYSTRAISLPPRYYADSVVEKVIKGKQQSDTLWHRVANIELTNQLGSKVSLDSLKDKVLIVDFFFTHCPSICPGMTRNMKKLQDLMKSSDPRRVIDTPLAYFLSISIDPLRDSVPVLKKYADQYGVDHDRWWMLTGEKEAIYNFGIRELKLGIMDGNGVDTLFDHSPKFVLLDRDHVVRGYYNGLDSLQVLRLSRDVVFLTLEKDHKRPSVIFQQLRELWPIGVVVVGSIFIFMLIGTRKKKTP